MIEVQCTSCHTRYRIDEQVLPEGTPTSSARDAAMFSRSTLASSRPPSRPLRHRRELRRPNHHQHHQHLRRPQPPPYPRLLHRPSLSGQARPMLSLLAHPRRDHRSSPPRRRHRHISPPKSSSTEPSGTIRRTPRPVKISRSTSTTRRMIPNRTRRSPTNRPGTTTAGRLANPTRSPPPREPPAQTPAARRARSR